MALDRQHMQSTLDAAGIDFPEDKRRLRSSTRKSDLRSRITRGMAASWTARAGKELLTDSPIVALIEKWQKRQKK
jgi:hypothetical protein